MWKDVQQSVGIVSKACKLRAVQELNSRLSFSVTIIANTFGEGCSVYILSRHVSYQKSAVRFGARLPKEHETTAPEIRNDQVSTSC